MILQTEQLRRQLELDFLTTGPLSKLRKIARILQLIDDDEDTDENYNRDVLVKKITDEYNAIEAEETKMCGTFYLMLS